MARARVLASFVFSSAIVIFDQETPLELLELVRPDILVKGGDYSIDQIVGRSFAKETIVLPFIHGFSTTLTLEKVKNKA